MPKFDTSRLFVDSATKCCETTASGSWEVTALRTQSRACCALDIVSAVVKVLDAIMKRVASGSHRLRVSTKSAGSTFDTKKNAMFGWVNARSASWAMAGPKSDPPMPIFTTDSILFPVNPRQSPLRTRSARTDMRSSTECTASTMSTPSTTNWEFRGRRNALCKTARSSV